MVLEDVTELYAILRRPPGSLHVLMTSHQRLSGKSDQALQGPSQRQQDLHGTAPPHRPPRPSRAVTLPSSFPEARARLAPRELSHEPGSVCFLLFSTTVDLGLRVT